MTSFPLSDIPRRKPRRRRSGGFFFFCLFFFFFFGVLPFGRLLGRAGGCFFFPFLRKESLFFFRLDWRLRRHPPFHPMN